MSLKIGDMVILIEVDPLSTGYNVYGVRKGDIGTIIERSDNLFCDWQVHLPNSKNPGFPCHCPENFLRKIDPPEAADGWKYCVFKPKVKELETI
jgi:hypothetical protein